MFLKPPRFFSDDEYESVRSPTFHQLFLVLILAACQIILRMLMQTSVLMIEHDVHWCQSSSSHPTISCNCWCFRVITEIFSLSTWSSSCFTRFTSGSGREGFLHRLQLVQNAQRRWGMITSPPALTSLHWLLKLRTDLITFYCSFLNGLTPAYISSLLTCYVPFDSWDLQMEPCSRSLCVTKSLQLLLKLVFLWELLETFTFLFELFLSQLIGL